MTVFTLTFLCVLGIFGALQVPGTSATWQDPSAVSPEEQEEIVSKHNDLRGKVEPAASNMLKMAWNDEIAANAERWANTCSMDHSTEADRKLGKTRCGENLFMASAKATWTTAVQAWYDEVKNWAHGKGSVNGGVVGHFTQVVWYNSREVGCAMAHCPDSKYKYFYVCQYCPAGNYNFLHPYTVGDRCSDCPNDCEDGLCTNYCPYRNQYLACPWLKEKYTCDNEHVLGWCPASCTCTTEII